MGVKRHQEGRQQKGQRDSGKSLIINSSISYSGLFRKKCRKCLRIILMSKEVKIQTLTQTWKQVRRCKEGLEGWNMLLIRSALEFLYKSTTAYVHDSSWQRCVLASSDTWCTSWPHLKAAEEKVRDKPLKKTMKLFYKMSRGEIKDKLDRLKGELLH